MPVVAANTSSPASAAVRPASALPASPALPDSK